MRRTGVIALSPLIAAMVVAGCGGGSKSSSGASASKPAASQSAPASSSTSSGAGASSYGQGSATPVASAGPAALVTTKHDKLGTILAYGPKKLTVYLFEADKAGRSSCAGACAAAWPPVIGKPQATGGAMSADLGTIKRSDGKTQVTYKGHPLYLFIKDKDAGDTYGEGSKAFGAGWYVLRPSGAKVDES